MPLPPTDKAELHSAALVLAHLAHFSSEPERTVLGVLDVDEASWDLLRESALSKVTDDLDAGLLFSRVFSRTKLDLATRNPPLESLAAAREPEAPPEPPPGPAPPGPGTAPLSAPALLAPPSPVARPLELPSFAREPPAVRVIAAPGRDTAALDPEVVRRAALPASDGDTLPAEGRPGHAPTALTLRQYAELLATLSLPDASRAALLVRAGLDEGSFAREDTLQRQRLASDAVALAQFRALYTAKGGRV